MRIWYEVTILRKEYVGSLSIDPQALYAYIKSVLKEIVENDINMCYPEWTRWDSEICKTVVIEVAYGM